MSRRIEVETGMNDVRDLLVQRGYAVEEMEQCVRPVEAVVYLGAPGVDASVKPRTKDAESTLLYNAVNQTPEEVVENLVQILEG